jgi:lipopolysaccharide export system permease protein
VWLNDLAYSWAKPGMSRVILHSIEEIAYQALRSRKSYISQAFAINVQDVQDKWLIHPTIIVYNQERGPSRTIFSERAKLSMNLEEETLEFELIDSEGNIGTHSLSWVGPAKFAFSLDRASRKGIEKNSPGQFALRDLGAEIRRQDEKNSKTRDAMAALCSMAMATGRFQLFDEPPLEELQRKLKDGSKRSLQLVTEPWKRWSLGFSCFLFVWVGTPLAIWMRSADNWTTFGVCFLPILLLYYPLYALGLEQAKAGHWPAYSLWIANLVWFVIGLFLIRRVCRN